MEYLIGFILLFTIFILLLLLVIQIKNRKQARHLFARLKAIDGFEMSQFIMGQQNGFLLAVDKTNEQLAYILPNSQILFPYDAILRVELLKDNKIVSKRVLSSAVNNPDYVEILNKEPSQLHDKVQDGADKLSVSRILIRLTLSQGESPWLPIYCFDARTQLFGGSRTLDLTNEESQMYRKGLEIAYHLDMLFGKILDRVDEEYLLNTVVEPSVKDVTKANIPKLIADELNQLFKLKQQGALSQEEFDLQKNKLLDWTLL